ADGRADGARRAGSEGARPAASDPRRALDGRPDALVAVRDAAFDRLPEPLLVRPLASPRSASGGGAARALAAGDRAAARREPRRRPARGARASPPAPGPASRQPAGGRAHGAALPYPGDRPAQLARGGRAGGDGEPVHPPAGVSGIDGPDRRAAAHP